MSLNKETFFKQVTDTFFDDLSCDFEGFKMMVKMVLPIFGELKVEISNDGEDTEIKFIDKDSADIYYAPDNYELSKEDLDMSSIALIIYVDNNKYIRAVDHNLDIFTPANKEIALFLASLINKRIENIK